MTIFHYDKTFEGLLSAVFDAYKMKLFPDKLLGAEDIPPLFTNGVYTVSTSAEHSQRVWMGMQAKLKQEACNMLLYVWLSETPESDLLIFRYICKIFATNKKIEYNFADADILEVQKIARKVAHESLYIKQFVRFQKAADGIYFAVVRPQYNALPLAVEHFTDRFADQPWVIYDAKRRYGYYYDLHETREITFDGSSHLLDGKLDEKLMADDEKLFQDLWKSYFDTIAIKERINPRKQRQDMPVRFWKYLTEKQ